ncbi:MAG: transposase [Cyclobacteriaceae bacterium]
MVMFHTRGFKNMKHFYIHYVQVLHLITNIRNNMKNTLMELKDKIMLRKISVIETVNDELKNNLPDGSQLCQIEHSRHRSFGNFITNLISGLIAYTFFPKKPGIKYETVQTNQIAIY